MFVSDIPDEGRTTAVDVRSDIRTDMPDMPGTVAELNARIGGLEALVEAQRAHIADLRAELGRRRWPGLKCWLRRFWEGGGGEA